MGRKKRRTTRFGRELVRSVRQLIDFLDGRPGCEVSTYVLPRDVREACGLEPVDMAERLGMGVDAYLAWEGVLFRVRNDLTFWRPRPALSPAEELAELVEAVRAGTRGDSVR